jgi:exopolysaccharide biosynthesis polyprenyl glycosylphosphotransferase
MDLAGSICAIVLFSPVMLVTAVCIKLTSPGPLIFCQERVGLHNRPFQMYKFRSMEVQSQTEEKKGWTTKDDPRVTKVGKFIRKTSIDELPQFFNVLMGDMRIVGPRPEMVHYVEQFRKTVPLYMLKHSVRPGITGLAQIDGLRGDTSIERRIEEDIFYIEHWSWFYDLKIILLTPFKAFNKHEKAPAEKSTDKENEK